MIESGLPLLNLPAFLLPGHGEWIILLVLGLLIFGRRLPEVGRSVGRSIVEFKKGIKGIEDEVDEAVKKPATPLPHEQARQQLPTEESPPADATPQTGETPAGEGAGQ